MVTALLEYLKPVSVLSNMPPSKFLMLYIYPLKLNAGQLVGVVTFCCIGVTVLLGYHLDPGHLGFGPSKPGYLA